MTNAQDQVIGTETLYIGIEPWSHRSCHVMKIVEVTKRFPAGDKNGPEWCVRDDEELARLGGVTNGDMIAIVQWLPWLARFSEAPRLVPARDVLLFRELRHPSFERGQRAPEHITVTSAGRHQAMHFRCGPFDVLVGLTDRTVTVACEFQNRACSGFVYDDYVEFDEPAWLTREDIRDIDWATMTAIVEKRLTLPDQPPRDDDEPPTA